METIRAFAKGGRLRRDGGGNLYVDDLPIVLSDESRRQIADARTKRARKAAR